MEKTQKAHSPPWPSRWHWWRCRWWQTTLARWVRAASPPTLCKWTAWGMPGKPSVRDTHSPEVSSRDHKGCHAELCRQSAEASDFDTTIWKYNWDSLLILDDSMSRTMEVSTVDEWSSLFASKGRGCYPTSTNPCSVHTGKLVADQERISCLPFSFSWEDMYAKIARWAVSVDAYLHSKLIFTTTKVLFYNE